VAAAPRRFWASLLEGFAVSFSFSFSYPFSFAGNLHFEKTKKVESI
jgi:hypothetical protein